MSFDVNNNPTGASVHFGPSYNVGVSATQGKAVTIRDGIDYARERLLKRE